MAETKAVSVIKCPGCGADMYYSPEKGALFCPYCETVREVAKTLPRLRDFFTERDDGEVGEGESVYDCPNCGGQVRLEDYATAAECPFCGATNIVKRSEFTGLKPDSILPFSFSREQAFAFGKKWLKRRVFAPGKLKKSFAVDHYKGVYLPTFTFDSMTASSYEGRFGEEYTVTVRDARGNSHVETRVRWYRVSGTIDKAYRNLLVEASSQLNQQQMNKISPFDLVTAEAYKSEYLAGFSAERYNSSLEDSFAVAKDLMDRDIENSITSRYHPDRIDYLNVRTSYNEVKFHYILVPVWVCGYGYRGKNYRFFVNGRTGKSTGKAPLSPVRVGGLALIVAAIIGVAVYLLVRSGVIG